MSFDVAAISSFIAKFVLQTPQKSASGTQIAKALRREFPGFDSQKVGARSLREFVHTSVPILMESSQRAGLDVVYLVKDDLLRGPSASPASESGRIFPPSGAGFASLLLNDPRAWKTYASPLSSSRVYVRTDGSRAMVSSWRSAPIGKDWVKIDPISADALLSIAEDFIKPLPELYRPALDDSLKQPKWWIPFFEVLGSVGLKSRWVAFRRRRILDEFGNAVTQAISGESAKLSQMIESSVSGPLAHAGGSIAGQASLQSEERLRALVLLAVQRMTLSELRHVPVPVGYLIDALDKLQ